MAQLCLHAGSRTPLAARAMRIRLLNGPCPAAPAAQPDPSGHLSSDSHIRRAAPPPLENASQTVPPPLRSGPSGRSAPLRPRDKSARLRTGILLRVLLTVPHHRGPLES